MLFTSFAFAIFLPIVFALYWILPHKYRWIVLLASSYYFYMSWNVKYISLILLVTVITYYGAIGIKAVGDQWKRYILTGVIVALLGILFLFKYWNFSVDTISRIFQKFAISLHPVTVQLILPVGISFYVFQTIGYVVDVYRGKVEPERHFGKYAVFVSFFPQLVAGPIERSQNLQMQLKKEHTFDYQTASYGLKRMAWGFFKKMVVADNLSVYVDTVYGNLDSYRGFSLIIVSIFFSFQIYCDFSGYSDIAVGTARLFGIRLMDNFKSPYFSASIKEFWKRWHISLSSWFQDYVYIPLGGSKKGKWKTQRNLMVTFLLSGLWHGAAWHYVVWGGIHGLYQIIENAVKEACGNGVKDSAFGRLIKMAFCFLCVDFAWIFFRLEIVDVWYVIRNMFVGILSPLQYIREGFYQLEINTLSLIKLVVYFVPLLLYDWFDLKGDVICWISERKRIFRWVVYYMIGLAVLLFGIHAASTEFIYFQF